MINVNDITAKETKNFLLNVRQYVSEHLDDLEDIYIAEHPIGSTVAGKVITETKKGKQLLIALGKNVHCHIKRDHHLSHGAIVSCRLTGYNKKKKTISAELV